MSRPPTKPLSILKRQPLSVIAASVTLDEAAKLSASRRFRLDGFSSVADPGHGRGAFVAEKQHLKRLRIESALRHHLLPANGLLNVGVNPQAQFVELLLMRLGAAFVISD